MELDKGQLYRDSPNWWNNMKQHYIGKGKGELGRAVVDGLGVYTWRYQVQTSLRVSMTSETRTLQNTYPTRKICTDLVSETSRLESFGRLYSTMAI